MVFPVFIQPPPKQPRVNEIWTAGYRGKYSLQHQVFKILNILFRKRGHCLLAQNTDREL